MASTIMDLLAPLMSCLSSCLPVSSSPTSLRIHSRSLKILRLLGEGGFSYVYLVQDTATSSLYALKKIRCPFGEESVSLALREVEAYNLYSHCDNIIHSIDHCVESDKSDPGAKTVYILLPYYRKGNLQDVINANLVNGTRVDEKDVMGWVMGVLRALEGMHHYEEHRNGAAAARKGEKKAKRIRDQAAREDDDAAEEAAADDEDDARRRLNQDDNEEDEPLMPSSGGIVLPNDPSAPKSYAHRDIKPSNIMLDDSSPAHAILMDLGSLAPSPIVITSRSLALQVQDTAAEHSTLPYRAPELFDVKTGSSIDTKVDVWSLGCTIFAVLIGKSPFEMRSEEMGGSLGVCVEGGDWRWPDEDARGKKGKGKKEGEVKWPSEGVRQVVARCLVVEPSERADIEELITLVGNVMKDLDRGSNGRA